MHCPRCQSDLFSPYKVCPNCGEMLNQLGLQSLPLISAPNSGDEKQGTSLFLSPKNEDASASSGHLQGGQYILVERQEHLHLKSDCYEVWWTAQEMKSGKQVSICEIVLPPNASMRQAIVRSATKALVASSHHPHLTPLLNVFMERDHSFFVFDVLDGESLQTRILRDGILREQQAIDGYLQAADALLFLSRQNPPIVHGSIQPEHIMIVDDRWVLTKGSVLLAGGVTAFISHVPMQISAYTAPEATAGYPSPRADIYSLTAAILFAVTGKPPSQVQGLPVQPSLSLPFTTVIARGMMALPQRFQDPSEIFQACGRSLDEERSRRKLRSSALTSLEREETQALSRTPDKNATQQPFPVVEQATSPAQPIRQEKGTLLPAPEELPPYPFRFDVVVAAVWIVGIVLFFSIFLFVA